ncbi:hypothetical protein ACFXTI_047363 [Malus domestica]
MLAQELLDVDFPMLERMIRDVGVPCRGKDDLITLRHAKEKMTGCSPATPSLRSYSQPAGSRTPHMCRSRSSMVIKLRFTGTSGGHEELPWRVGEEVRGGRGSRRRRAAGGTNAEGGAVKGDEQRVDHGGELRTASEVPRLGVGQDLQFQPGCILGSVSRLFFPQRKSSYDNYKNTEKRLGAFPEELCRHFSLAEITTTTQCFDVSLFIGRGDFGLRLAPEMSSAWCAGVSPPSPVASLRTSPTCFSSWPNVASSS